MSNQASEDELKERIGNLHAYNFDGDDVTVKVMVDEDNLESIAKFVEAIIRTEKLKLLAEIGEPKFGDVVLMQPEQYEGGVIINDWYKNRINELEAEL